MRRCRQHPSEAGKPHNRPRSPRSRTCYPGTIRRRSASGVSVLVSIWWATRARVARRWREQYDAESGASRQTTSDHPVGADRGTVKLRLTAVSDPQHGGFTAGSSPVSWGSSDELFVNLTVPRAAIGTRVLAVERRDEGLVEEIWKEDSLWYRIGRQARASVVGKCMCQQHLYHAEAFVFLPKSDPS